MNRKIKFSPQPGAYERHLQRKYQNPLFPASEQALFEKEVEQARARDQQDLRSFLEAFETTVKETAELAGSVESEILLELKEKLERLYVQSASLAGDPGQYRDALSRLIDVCMNGIRQGAADDQQALKKLEQETVARQVYFDLLNTPIVADLMRGDEVIQASELIATILSEPEEHLPVVMELFEPEYQQQILQGAEAQTVQLDPATGEALALDSKLHRLRQILEQA